MLTRLRIRNFKRFDEADIELGNPVVFIGPNNAGKSTALQALALWDVGYRKWAEKYDIRKPPTKRPGVTINRRDLLALPVHSANQLWKDLHTRQRDMGGAGTKSIKIHIAVDGMQGAAPWSVALEFDYANPESFYCRLLTDSDAAVSLESAAPLPARTKLAYLPPMSGLAAEEPRLEPGRVNVLIGQGQTAQVLRNLCFDIYAFVPDSWPNVQTEMRRLFGTEILDPVFVEERGEITLAYREGVGPALDISSSGRGMQQVLLLLAYLYSNPGSVLLLDEPDAHLEVLRQRQIYNRLSRLARDLDCQVIAATHSEVVLNEAAARDTVIAFVGSPHRLENRRSEVRQALAEYGFEHYYLAQQCGWVFYLEGSTDLAILQAFASRLSHPAAEVLERPFTHFIGNNLSAAHKHFNAVREAVPSLAGVAVVDRQPRALGPSPQMSLLQWERREIENYICQPETLLAFAQAQGERPHGPLIAVSEGQKLKDAMRECIELNLKPVMLRDRSDPAWDEFKATDEFLDPVFTMFALRAGPEFMLRKGSYYKLVEYVPSELISPEISTKLDAIQAVADSARR